MNDEATQDLMSKRKRNSLYMAVFLFGLVAMFYVITILKMAK